MKIYSQTLLLILIAAFVVNAQVPTKKAYDVLINDIELLQNENQYEKAIELISKAIINYPDQLELPISRAKLYRNDKQLI